MAKSANLYARIEPEVKELLFYFSQKYLKVKKTLDIRLMGMQ